MRIDWKGVLNRAPEALNKLVSLGMTIDQYDTQKKMQRCIWEGYGRFGMNAMGGMGYGCNYWDSNTILNNCMLQMRQYTTQVIEGTGGSGAVGGGTTGSPTGTGTVQAHVAPGQGLNLANGKDTKFIDNDEWTALNNEVKGVKADEKQIKKRNEYYKSSLKSLADSFAKSIDKNGDGKISEDEFVQYFSKMIKGNVSNKSAMAEAAWNKINFNNTDFRNSLDDEELTAFLSYLDATDFKEIDGNIESKNIGATLLSIASSDDTNIVKNRLTEINGKVAEETETVAEEEPEGNEDSDGGNGL